MGFTTGADSGQAHGFEVIGADGQSGWRRELAEQIAKLPVGVEYVILFLDDFLLLQRVDTRSVGAILRTAISGELPYTGLRAPDRGLAALLWRKVSGRFRAREIIELGPDEPYFSSLPIAVWRRDHLLRSLREPGSIWEFEHQACNGARHYAAAKSVIEYRHVVERGEWLAYAPRLFRSVGLTFEPGQRKLRPRSDELLHAWYRIKFLVIGYHGLYLRRFLRRAKALVTSSSGAGGA